MCELVEFNTEAETKQNYTETETEITRTTEITRASRTSTSSCELVEFTSNWTTSGLNFILLKFSSVIIKIQLCYHSQSCSNTREHLYAILVICFIKSSSVNSTVIMDNVSEQQLIECMFHVITIMLTIKL